MERCWMPFGELISSFLLPADLTIQQILLKYWGYASFRPLQEDIIQSVLSGKDTLALLPTGGGKSICFQVPALARDGFCLVVSPLIALMKDQVENLKKKGIRAEAIHSGMFQGEIDIALNNARYGQIKLLYISPERLQTSRFREALRHYQVNLIAVDEAHCISQWGYDFRPPYRTIAEIRELFPGIPILALTATATQQVVDDIQLQLKFPSPNLIRQSFERKNLAYMVFYEENKQARLLKIIRTTKGSGIIYVRSRKKTVEVADFLTKSGIPAGFYHAGMTPVQRNKSQESWISNKVRVMVATNAFGMGIDKPDVRFVVHLDIPDNLEAYFQEAGRAGRDGKQAYAVILHDNTDMEEAIQHVTTSFPDLKTIRNIYQGLGNFLQIPLGAGKDVSLDFDLPDFCRQFKLNPVQTYHALKLLEKEGYLLLGESFENPSRIHIKASKEDLYRFQVENQRWDMFIKTILRSYSGVFAEYVKVSESELARRMSSTTAEVIENLTSLHNQELLEYIPKTDKPRITLLTERLDKNHLSLSREHYRDRKADAMRRLQSVVDYLTATGQCRSALLLHYFDERSSLRCGICDQCILRNKVKLNEITFQQIYDRIHDMLKTHPCSLEVITQTLSGFQKEEIIQVLRWMEDTGQIIKNTDEVYEKG